MLDHLEYLRLRIIRAALAYLAASVVGWFLTPWVLQRLISTETGLAGLVFLSPSEAFFSRMKLAFALGLVIGLPFILYQIWALFVPAMTKRQKWVSLVLLPGAYGLFLGGILFAMFAVLPLALRFFLSFGGEGLQQEISVANYVSFVISFVLPFGAIFELPVIVVFLARIGVLRQSTLTKNRKYAIFLIFVVSAVLTPADVFSMFMMAVPILVLYEVSVVLARFVAPKGEFGVWSWDDADQAAPEE